MHTLRLSLITIATVFLVTVPVAASACGDGEWMGGVPDGFMATPVSMRGQFIYVNRISRRMLRHAVADQQQPARFVTPLPREIL